MKIDGYTRLAAVVAKPIKHSISPFIHNYAFDALGINGVYLAFEIDEEDLAETIQNIRRYNMWGINLSMPYKTKVLPYLDAVDKSASMFGVVNTIVNQDGYLTGYNTDGQGFFASLPDTFNVADKTVTILGGKGAATAIATYASLHGVKTLHLFCKEKYLSETMERKVILEAETHTVISVNCLEDEACVQKCISESDLVVNAGSQGMDKVSLPISKNLLFNSHQLVADIIYQPLETPFLKMAKRQGCQTVNGLGMLLHQAAGAFELWTNQSMPVAEIAVELEKYYQD